MTQSEMTMREVGRHAIRLSLARVAFEKFCLQGFAKVTFDELASAAGVSRSTFLRHFHTKEDAVLFVFDIVGEAAAAALSSDDGQARADLAKTAHRAKTAVHAAASRLLRETPELLAVMDLVETTPELRAGLFAKQSDWIEEALPAAVQSSDGEDEVVVEARMASVFACLTVALRRWATGGGNESLEAVLDRTLAALP